jgi:hypothetical protein
VSPGAEPQLDRRWGQPAHSTLTSGCFDEVDSVDRGRALDGGVQLRRRPQPSHAAEPGLGEADVGNDPRLLPTVGCTDIVDPMNCNFPDARSVHFASTDPGTSWSKDGWIAIDLDRQDPAAKVVTPNVVALPGGGYRMYFEAGSRDRPTVVLSAHSDDGLTWQREDGIRVGQAGSSLGSPRCVYLAMPGPAADAPSRGCRLYYHRRPFPERRGVDPGHGIRSATSDDGVHFDAEPGMRIVPDSDLESFSLYAPEVLRLAGGDHRMYYAGWSQAPWHGRIFTAVSADGVSWRKDPTPCLEFGGPHDAVKVSEPCVIGLPDGRYRMFYEGCDEDGNWRILSALSRP